MAKKCSIIKWYTYIFNRNQEFNGFIYTHQFNKNQEFNDFIYVFQLFQKFASSILIVFWHKYIGE